MNTVYLGIDFHKNTCTLCFLSGGKETIETIKTQSLPLYLSNKIGVRIAIETTGGVNHYVNLLRSQGHDVTLVPTGVFRGIGVGGKKTDERDARALAIAHMNGAIPSVYIKSESARRIKSLIVCREEAVNTRTGLICHIRGTLAEYGLRMPVGREQFSSQVRMVLEKLDTTFLKEVIELKLERIKQLDTEITRIEELLKSLHQEDSVVERLASIPGIGLLGSIMLRMMTEDVSRFKNANHFAAYLGLVPSVSASATTRHMGSITKSGSELTRRYLIHGARAAMRYSPEGDKLLSWAKKVEERRGTNKATVALARRLATIAFAMVRDDSAYLGRVKKKKRSSKTATISSSSKVA